MANQAEHGQGADLNGRFLAFGGEEVTGTLGSCFLPGYSTSFLIPRDVRSSSQGCKEKLWRERSQRWHLTGPGSMPSTGPHPITAQETASGEYLLET